MSTLPRGNCPELDPKHCATLNTVLQECANTRELIKACKDCGLPVEEGEAQNNQQIQYATAIKAKFFPLNG